MKSHLFSVCFLLALSLSAASYADQRSHKIYIVYLGKHSGEKAPREIEDTHHAYLWAVKGCIHKAKASLLYSYKNVINGFSALLTPEEAYNLSEMDEVISVFESKAHTTQTTWSWDFVNILEGGGGQREELLKRGNYGKDIIVGVLDTGIWPESQSFSDEGMEPIPAASWKGICQEGEAFDSSLCNRKLIGARYYPKSFEQQFGPINRSVEYASPRDKNGHGTHTASIVAGRAVPNASSHGGFARGTITGGAPLARIAVYKVCWTLGGGGTQCTDADVIAAFDDAISDGVHVISLSVGNPKPEPYVTDGIAVGSLHAVKNNVVVVASAGNSGPKTVSNVAPWLITVAASTIDREFSSSIILGNGVKITGQSVTPLITNLSYPLVYAASAEIPGKTTPATSGLCKEGTLAPELVKGKIVVCLGDGSAEVKRAGGAAAISLNTFQGSVIILDERESEIPSIILTIDDTIAIINYISSSKHPTATLIPPQTTFGNSAPVISPFSATGPNGLDPNILKPDVSAPGVNILAAWSQGVALKNLPGNQRVKYNMLSGTSMACPHVSATAILLKAIHPGWSSAAIRSAIMTTATTINNEGKPIKYSDRSNANAFQYGAGHFQPSKAVDPGLVYDATYYDYHLFLCASNSPDGDECPKDPPSQSNLNYPSLAIANITGAATISRIVTNVAGNEAFYKLTIQSPPGFIVDISPPTLQFSGVVGETKSFNVTITKAIASDSNSYAFGFFVWSDGIHEVRSPIVVS